MQALQTFAAETQQSLTSIRMALATDWSNGQAEGHVSKLKLLKRRMYRRARFEFFHRRRLLAP